MNAFQVVADAAFMARVADFLRLSLAATTVRLPVGEAVLGELDDVSLRQMIAASVERARGYGLKSEAALASFAAIAFLIAPNFDEHPLLRRTLVNSEIDPDKRLAELAANATEENWRAARAAARSEAWGLPGATKMEAPN